MKVLVACEYSGIVRDAFTKRGHFAVSCDLLPTESPGWHYMGDVFDIINDGWDLMIAHPPCTYLTVTANKWLKEQPKRKSGNLVGKERLDAREEAVAFFMALYNAPIKKIAIENPIGCMSSRFRKPDQVVHPYMFGHPVSKATCLWLKELPILTATDIVNPEWHTTKEGRRYPKWSMIEAANIRDLKERAKFRSKTFSGIAEAMATQWG